MAQSLLTERSGDGTVVLRVIFIVRTHGQPGVAGTGSSHPLWVPLPLRGSPHPQRTVEATPALPQQRCLHTRAPIQPLSPTKLPGASLPNLFNVLRAQLFGTLQAVGLISVCFPREPLQQVPHLPCPPSSPGATLNIWPCSGVNSRHSALGSTGMQEKNCCLIDNVPSNESYPLRALSNHQRQIWAHHH